MAARWRRAIDLPSWLRSSLGELRGFEGPVPVQLAVVTVGMDRGHLVEAIDAAAIAAARAGVTGGDYTAAHWRWWALACLRELAWRRVIGRVGPVGGPYSYHPLGG